MTVIFLDRDGVINENRMDYVKSWQEFQFLPGACEAIARLSSAGHQVVICTNQAGIATGCLTGELIESIHRRMLYVIEQAGGHVAGIYYCPHGKQAGCDCRKPRPGLLLRAAQELQLDLTGAVFVGDGLTDIQAALAAGVTPMLVLTGRGKEQLRQAASIINEPFLVVKDLPMAVSVIGNGKAKGDVC
ncbi:D-glycero-beta-D-manno-heptose 1,7-bisphosphate 7-phosphatase [Dictyobacter formicarum]|uniref:D,D-heptose 1,7-bisphosphate phosphatase n=1 Tax=Dictyobacter formicarum TaxID=2778368 RepID=A0ABQ3V8E4_9CHLR|nr:D-glycero-beta-D-manno-heptose 1,7-bisphosphate 7-phosphatase [Dictyobacter formicarum]GHO82114.1 D,D-heptose 1,7-bisphosphate phosphatase [Dictyobacter formicarum]